MRKPSRVKKGRHSNLVFAWRQSSFTRGLSNLHAWHSDFLFRDHRSGTVPEFHRLPQRRANMEFSIELENQTQAKYNFLHREGQT
jgi:hypothetical protein